MSVSDPVADDRLRKEEKTLRSRQNIWVVEIVRI